MSMEKKKEKVFCDVQSVKKKKIKYPCGKRVSLEHISVNSL